jgi:hypothetical protein
MSLNNQEGNATADGSRSAGLPKFSSKFPPDYGDFIIESKEGVKLYIPRSLLLHASPVFRDMFDFGTEDEKNIVRLHEDYITLENLLLHVDPSKADPRFKWRSIANLLAAAHKYDVKNIMQRFSSWVSLKMFESGGSKMEEPFLCLALAYQYGLEDIAKKALRQLIRYPILEVATNTQLGAHLVRHLMMLRTEKTLALATELLNLEKEYGAVFHCHHTTPFQNWAQPALELLIMVPSKESIFEAERKKLYRCTCYPVHYPKKWLDRLKEIEDELPVLPTNI